MYGVHAITGYVSGRQHECGWGHGRRRSLCSIAGMWLHGGRRPPGPHTDRVRRGRCLVGPRVFSEQRIDSIRGTPLFACDVADGALVIAHACKLLVLHWAVAFLALGASLRTEAGKTRLRLGLSSGWCAARGGRYRVQHASMYIVTVCTRLARIHTYVLSQPGAAGLAKRRMSSDSTDRAGAAPLLL